jgi:hypothetical protein
LPFGGATRYGWYYYWTVDNFHRARIVRWIDLFSKGSKMKAIKLMPDERRVLAELVEDEFLHIDSRFVDSIQPRTAEETRRMNMLRALLLKLN